MDVETAIRTRRTHKAYRPEPVDRETLDELLELARWAPNHHLTNPWRFRVVGPQALERLKEAAGPEAAAKLDRAPTLVVCSCRARRRRGPGRGGPARDRRRRLHRPARRPRPRAGRLLAHAGRPARRRRAARRSGSPDEERFVGLIHLGRPVQEKPAPEREPAVERRHLPRLSRARAAPTQRSRRSPASASTWSSIGGGITGAGVALDAASRGYSVALVERDDYAVGTSSRSSKMVHGGLRYLQNFDLGLVREALLERQLMVQLAPHLVYPTPFLVPTLGDEQRSRAIGIGLNMYDVMATTRVGMSRRERAERIAGDDYWAPDRHRTIDGEEVARDGPGAGGRASPASAYLFYDCQTDDVRLVLTILGEAERFGAVCLNGAEVTGLLDRDGRAAGVACVDAETRRAVRGRGRQRDQRDRGLGRPDPPRGDPRRGRGAADRAQPRHPRHRVDRSSSRLGTAACIVPAGEERTIFALPWYGRTLIGTTDNDYDGDIAHVQPGDDDIDYLLDAANAFFGTELGTRRPDRRLRRRAAADLDRRPAQVGRHLAQGRALRDLLGDADDHRRQADHLAADGQAGRRPDGRARGPGRALPHRRHPARDGGGRARARPARRDLGGVAARTVTASCSPSATGTPARNVLRLAGERPELARADRRRASPTCSPRSWSPPGSSRRARSPTCSCAAPGSGCSRRRSCAPPTRSARSPRRSAASSAGTSERVARRGGALARGRGGRGHRPRARA